ncbi:MAG: FmdB family zinc ribbon protein [Opitutaceae bacterium]
MPTYEYVCQKCGHEFEQFQSMKDEPLKKCPKCKKAGLKRLVGGGAGLIFKGSGFYITDYKNKNASGAPKKEGEGGTAKPAETKSSDPKPAESKPAAAKPADAKPAASTGESKTASKSAAKK